MWSHRLFEEPFPSSNVPQEASKVPQTSLLLNFTNLEEFHDFLCNIWSRECMQQNELLLRG